MGQGGEVVPELDRDRLIEPVSVVVGGTDRVGGPLAEERSAGVARQDMAEEEDQGEDAEEDRNGEQDAADDVAEHPDLWSEREKGARHEPRPLRLVDRYEAGGFRNPPNRAGK